MFCVNDSPRRNRAIVHRDDCEYAAPNVGHSKVHGGWLTGYRTASAAIEQARSLGRGVVRSCRTCRPATTVAHASAASTGRGRADDAPDRPPGMYAGKLERAEDLSVELDGLEGHPSLREEVCGRPPATVRPGESERESRNVGGHSLEIRWQRLENGRYWGRARIVAPAPDCERCRPDSPLGA